MESTFLEMELNHFPNLEGAFTIWEVTGGMPLVDLVDLLNLTGEGLGSVGSIDSLASALTEETVS